MLKNGFKLEVEALITKGISYVTEEYVPARLEDALSDPVRAGGVTLTKRRTVRSLSSGCHSRPSGRDCFDYGSSRLPGEWYMSEDVALVRRRHSRAS